MGSNRQIWLNLGKCICSSSLQATENQPDKMKSTERMYVRIWCVYLFISPCWSAQPLFPKMDRPNNLLEDVVKHTWTNIQILTQTYTCFFYQWARGKHRWMISSSPPTHTVSLHCLLPHITWFKRLPLDHVELYNSLMLLRAIVSCLNRSASRAGDQEAARSLHKTTQSMLKAYQQLTECRPIS